MRDVLVCAVAVNGQAATRTTTSSCRRVERMERPPLVVSRDGKELTACDVEGAAGTTATPETKLPICDGGSISLREMASSFLAVFLDFDFSVQPLCSLCLCG